MFDCTRQFTPESIIHLPRLIGFLNTILGITPTNTELLLVSAIHKSYARDYVGDFAYNERLEFTGDAILGHIVAQYLYENYNNDESILSMYKVFLIREETLAECCLDIGRDTMIMLSKGEEGNGGREKSTILADCFEALIGYIAVDKGFETVRDVLIEHLIIPRLHLLKPHLVKNPKSVIQEYSQAQFKQLPDYQVTEHEFDSKGNVIIYQATIAINNEIVGTGTAKNKRLAEEEAARDAMNTIPGLGDEK